MHTSDWLRQAVGLFLAEEDRVQSHFDKWQATTAAMAGGNVLIGGTSDDEGGEANSTRSARAEVTDIPEVKPAPQF